jgi:hypothetical protein
MKKTMKKNLERLDPIAAQIQERLDHVLESL